MKLRIFLLFLFLSLFRAQADVIDSLMTHPRDSIALTSDSLVLRFLSESGIPISDNNKVRLLKSGREKFIDLFSAIRDAKHHIHLEYFNFRNDSIANALFDLLAEKVKEGVEVRAMFDAFGNWSNNKPLKKRHLKKIREQGIEIVKFDPFTFPYINHAAHRDHRKIAVIDGEVAYTGGMNIADYYINGLPKIGTWRDMHMRIEGDAVNDLQEIFLTIWNKETKQNIGGEAYFPKHKEQSDSIFSDRPNFDTHRFSPLTCRSIRHRKTCTSSTRILCPHPPSTRRFNAPSNEVWMSRLWFLLPPTSRLLRTPPSTNFTN